MGYFDEVPVTGAPVVPSTGQVAPIVPPAPPAPQAPVVPQAPVTPATEPQPFRGLPVRAMGDRVFVLLKGKKYWVTTAEVYQRIGFKFGDEVKIDQETLDVIPEGEPIR